MKKQFLLHWILCILFLIPVFAKAQELVTDKNSAQSFSLDNASIYVSKDEYTNVLIAAAALQQDIKAVTGKSPKIVSSLKGESGNIIIIGSLEKSSLVQQLVNTKKINNSSIKNKWECYLLQSIVNPFPGITNAIIITGSDRRGTAFGVFELSKQIGVSPWYWWADVPVKKRASIYIKKNIVASDAPKVKYRGIFLNDEAPALSNWTKEKFGGFNHQFYSKVFELMLRLKSNYIWPAMWGNAFYDDDSLNIKAADDYGIVIGTSHHEPLMRAHDEWRRYGQKQKWNYDSTEIGLKEFWQGGMKRAWNEKIVSVGMRGDGDEPMSRQTATTLLERIVKDQRKIIEDVTGKPAAETPQLWALYKEVQDYYDKGMRVPDDVTLLLCDDNWGNIRRLPKLDEKPRKGGYGIYYHFDYVGDPRNYKWLNTNPIPRTWEQMHLAWEFKVRQIWIVNVGDLKPMEFPISFFLDYAWNPEKIGPDQIQSYTIQWSEKQFGKNFGKEIADIISKYQKYNGRRKPELLDANTYSLNNYDEFETVVKDYNNLLAKAEKINSQLPVEYRGAYFQLVLHPVKACANLNELYFYVAKNKEAYNNKNVIANRYADKVKELYLKDSLITLEYHQLANGKWNHLMDQTHIGYTYWQQPLQQKMPEVNYVTANTNTETAATINAVSVTSENLIPKNVKGNFFFEKDGYVSIDAAHFTRPIPATNAYWKVLPDHGRLSDAVTLFPATSSKQEPGKTSPHLQYEIYVYDTGMVTIQTYFSPSLNFRNDEGLQYGISIDDENPHVISINKDDDNAATWRTWVAANIIVKKSNHQITKPGKHIIRFWAVNPGVVVQKLVVDFGGVKPSYFGPPETMKKYSSK